MKLLQRKSILPFIKISLAILFFCEPIFAQESRNALLIANGKYSHFSSLSEPIKEAENLRNALEQLGFTVKIVKNASLEAMNDALSDFEVTLKKSGGIGFFHYGGHAVQVAGKNYLIPSTADISDERRVSTRALNVDEVMNCMAADTNIVILDSCRNNPLPAGSGRSASRGLVVSTVKPKNSIIVYSAEAGCTAQDGVFTPAFTKEITHKGMSLQAVLINVRKEVQRLTDGEQTPGEYSQMTDIVYLAGKEEPHFASVSRSGGTISVHQAAGSLKIASSSAGDVYLDGVHAGTVRAYGTLVLDTLPAGMYTVEIRGSQMASRNVIIQENETAEIRFGTETEHVKAQAESGGIRFTIRRPEDKNYCNGAGTIIIYKFGKNGTETVRAVVEEGKAARTKTEWNCLFPLCQDGEKCSFLVQIEPPDGNTDKEHIFKEQINIRAKGGSGFSHTEKGRAEASFVLLGKPAVSIEETAFWKARKRTVRLAFFAGSGDFQTSGETIFFDAYEKKLDPGEPFTFNAAQIAPKLKATGKKEFFVEFLYRFDVPGSKGIRYFCTLQSRSNIARME